VDLRSFVDQLRALLPGGFTPQGSGQLKILIAHPEVKQVPGAEVEGYLKRELALPADSGAVTEFRPAQADSIVIVLFRTSMAINEVREVRELLRFWAGSAQVNDQADYLRWRQRLGYHLGWLAMTEDNRELILHRLMCAMWNGQVKVEGPLESPRAVLVQAVEYAEAQPMRLPLQRVGQTSSWGSLLRAYELWTVEDDDSARRQFAASLRVMRPRGLTDDVSAPSEVYQAFVEVAREESARVEKFRDGLPPGSRGRADQLLEFWMKTFPAAETRPFAEFEAVRGNLRELYEYMTGLE
jgi:hypothetical protein